MKLLHVITHESGWRHPREQIPTWRQMHPEAEIRYWTLGEMAPLTQEQGLGELYNSMPFLLQRLNLARLLVVHRFGGIYMDADTECLKPMDDLFKMELVFGWVNNRVVSNAILGAAEPGHQCYAGALEAISGTDQRIERDTEAIRSSGAEHFTRFLRESGFATHALPAAALYSRAGYTFHHAGRPAWVGKQYIGGKLHENRSELAPNPRESSYANHQSNHRKPTADQR